MKADPLPAPARPLRPAARWCRTLAWAAALVPAAACPHELMLHDMPAVYAASGFEQPAGEAPSSVSVITERDIARFGWRTLAQALGSLRGFHTSHDGVYDYAGVRGLLRPGDWNSRILLLVDGHRVNDNVFGQAMLGSDAVVDMAAVERIEVVRGPGSSLYGASAVFAVVDVTTRGGRDYRGAEVEASAGSHGLRGARAAGGDRRGGVEYAVSVSATRADGNPRLFYPELADSTPSGGVSSDADAQESSRVLATLRWRQWSAELAGTAWARQVPTGAYGTVLSDPRNEYRQQRAYVRLGFDDEWRPGTRIKVAWSADRFAFEGDYRYADVTNRDRLTGAWTRVEAVVDHRVDDRTRLSAGLDVQHDDKIELRNEDVAVYLDERRSGRAAGAFAQVEHVFRPDLRLNAGLRIDRYSTFGSTANPRVGLMWQPVEHHLLKLLAGRAFRAPNAFELWYHDGGSTQQANPALKPERVRTVEFVWESAWSERLHATVSAYRNGLHSLIDASVDEGSGLLQYRNAGTITTTGVEAQVDARIGSRVDARVSASWQESVASGAPPLSNSPRLLLKAAVLVALGRDGATLAVESRSVSRARTLAGSELPGYSLVHATLASPLGGTGWTGSLGVANVFDRRHSQPAGQEHHPVTALPQPGREWLARLGFAF